jgi:tetratricopeptide (TPR) repeat protein
MTSGNIAEDVDELNQRALSTLSRSITVLQGRFALTLVRCNYTALQYRLAHSLKATCPIQIQEFILPPHPENLWQPILNATPRQQQTALMVFGITDVYNLPALLHNLDSERSNLISHCHQPIALWLNEETLSYLVKLAPNFYASTVTAITLLPSLIELNILWRESSDQLFGKILTVGLDRFHLNEALGYGLATKFRQELKAATKDLKSKKALPPALTATWHLILGRDDHAQGRLGEALVHYHKSLQIWEQLQSQTTIGEMAAFTHNALQTRWAILKLHMGLCYQQQAGGTATHWPLARDAFLSVVRVFEQQQRWDTVRQVLTLTGDTLRAMGNWLELENVANSVLAEKELQSQPLNMAQAHGFLAEVALHHNDFTRAAEHARYALSLTQQYQSDSQIESINLARYLLLVAKIEARSGEFLVALNYLEKAQVEVPNDSQLYLDIIQELRLLYYHQGQFWESFQAKQQHQFFRHQQGLTAFVGTAAALDQPLAIGRERDVQELVDRLSNDHQKLVVLHGESGMGKSSLLHGGIIPALHGQIVADRQAVVATLKTYQNWTTQLSESLSNAVGHSARPGAADLGQIQQQLRININNQLLTVLIFDQFEEFFVVSSPAAQRQEFYQFFQDCLALPHVKMLFSIRQDALHHLLELERCVGWNQIGESLLDRQIRYQLRNFSINQAQSVISNLTSNCHYYIEPALVDQLVSDLADEYAEIPPAQLQMIGAQLQAENVKTLGQYFKLAPKPQQYLIERALEEAIRDCGKQNLAAVLTALFLLTDSRGNRPQRTFSQLLPATTGKNNSEKLRQSSNISTSSSQHNYYAQLLLLLNILVGSGLIACTKSEPEHLYQLVHDDLVETIRSKYLAQQQEPDPNRKSRVTSQNRSMIRTSRIHTRKGRWPWVQSMRSGVQQLVETVRQHPVWNNISNQSMAVIDRISIGVTNVLKSLIALVVRKKS